MGINHFRIDDRLIHGQIVTVWIRDAGASTIVVADDIASKDEMQKMLLKLATPSHIKLIIVSLDEAIETLNSIEEGVLLLVRNPNAALKLYEDGLSFSKINVGNIGNSSKGGPRKTLNAYIHVGEKDIEALEKLYDSGVELDTRSVPTDRSFNIIDMIRK